MKLGLFIMPIHNHERDYHQTLMEDIEAIVHADRLGFSEAWVGEHHGSKSEQITSPLLFLSHVLPQTEQIVCGTGVICLPQYHPAVTAGHIAMFDHLAKGRYIAGLGPGGWAGVRAALENHGETIADGFARSREIAEETGMVYIEDGSCVVVCRTVTLSGNEARSNPVSTFVMRTTGMPRSMQSARELPL